MFEPCQSGPTKHIFGSVLGTWFGVKCRSWKSPFENTSLHASIPTWKPPVWFLVSEWGPHLELKSSKLEAWNAHANLWDPKVVPRWPQVPKLTQNGSKLTRKMTQNQCFWDSFSTNYAMPNGISSIRNNEWSNTNQIVPTGTKKTHTTQRGVGGTRRRPGKVRKCQRLDS